MYIKKYILLISILILNLNSCIAQNKGYNITTKSKRAEKFYIKALNLTNKRCYIDAETHLKKAIKIDNKFIEAYLLLGDIFHYLKQDEEAIDAYKETINISPDFFPLKYFIIANIELSVGKYEDAKKHYRAYLNYPEISIENQKKCEDNLKNCEFAINAVKNPVPFKPVNIGDSINTKNREYSPTLTADEQTFIFTVSRAKDKYTNFQGSKEEEDFYISIKNNNVWTKATKMRPPVNSHGNEGAGSISSDGKTLFFTACNRSDGYGSCDLYYSKQTGDNWTKPVNLGPHINSNKWDSQPCISSDNKTIYFASARNKGKGNMDIWETTLMPDGKWGTPVNLGDIINTKGKEMSPFIHPDGQTLYFASDGHTGMGKMDIFLSRKDKNGNWTKPVNLGYPINTCADENNMIVNTSGEIACFSSDRFGGKGKEDLYQFLLYENIRPQKVTYMKGIVFDSHTKTKIKAKFELMDLETGKTIVQSFSDPVNGEFLICLPTNKNYALNVSKKEYLFYSENFSLKNYHSKISPFLKNIPLKQIKIGETVVLKNIFFETAKYDLKIESKIELEKLIQFLKNNPQIKIELSGHTDNTGKKDYNQNLSENRAKTVYNYLINKNITKQRLSYKGYGDTKPVDTNNTEQGKANNRRTEFKVIEK